MLLVADCKESLPALTELIQPNNHQEWIESFKPLDEMERVKVIEPAIHPKEGPLLMGEVVHAIANQAPDNAILVTDVGCDSLLQISSQA